MNRLIKKASVVSVLTLSCSAAFAAGSLNAKVVAVDGGDVVLQVEGEVPEWVSEGGVVQALGWKPKVTDVEGTTIVLTLSKSRAAKVKPDSEVVIREIPKQQKFGC